VRAALVVSLGVLWLNYLLTSRPDWAGVDGWLHGPKQWIFLPALIVASALAVWPRRGAAESALSVGTARVAAAAGCAWLAVAFFIWFPPHTWSQIPFLDDWPARYQATRDFIALLDRGTLTGWQWAFLGGYHSSSDVTQSLGLLAYVPMKVFGAAVGFHVVHLLLFAALPALGWIDLRLDERADARVTALGTGLFALLAAGYSYFLVRSGDTNSLAGVVTAFAAIVGAHAARRGRGWGGWLLVLGLALTNYAHAGFFAYAALYVVLDALLARDRPSLVRAGLAIACGALAAVPLTVEWWRYPAFFSFNNRFYAAPAGFDWREFGHQLYYNVELLWLPNRWFSDYTGLVRVFLPAAVALAVVDRSRARFYAWALIATLAVTRLDDVQLGFIFLRPIHMLAIFAAPVLAALVVRYAGSRAFGWALVAVVAAYVQVWYHAVPHVPDLRAFNGELVDRVRGAGGALVVVENNPHLNMNADPGGTTERSRFGVHFEPILADVTGRRLYAGYWDGWQWSPWKGQAIGGGAWLGRALASAPHDVFVDAMRRWGVVDLFVWSRATSAYLKEDARFEPVWTDGVWTEFALGAPDPREVAVEPPGQARLEHVSPTGADVVLSGVRAGSPVVVRTNFHPAWRAFLADRPVALTSREGQLSFEAPCSGDCVVALRYPRYPWLIALAVLGCLAGGGVAARSSRRARRREATPRNTIESAQ
jgi:hypothetical protein